MKTLDNYINEKLVIGNNLYSPKYTFNHNGNNITLKGKTWILNYKLSYTICFLLEWALNNCELRDNEKNLLRIF